MRVIRALRLAQGLLLLFAGLSWLVGGLRDGSDVKLGLAALTCYIGVCVLGGRL